MTRPDLKSEFNGWQASDPTPQEKSEGNNHSAPLNTPHSFCSMEILTNVNLSSLFWRFPSGVYCCGPIPVRAIKEGDLMFKYDALFVFSEVNADVVTFRKNKDGSTSQVYSTAVVGQKISTKSVGSDAREDITHLYKYPEGREQTVHVDKLHKVKS